MLSCSVTEPRLLPRLRGLSATCTVKHQSTPSCVLPYTVRVISAGFGAAYGTAKSGVGIASMGVMRPELVMKSIVPVVMAGVLGIYGLIIAVIISTGSDHHSLLLLLLAYCFCCSFHATGFGFVHAGVSAVTPYLHEGLQGKGLLFALRAIPC